MRTIEIQTHDGQKYQTEMEVYNANELTAQLNDGSVTVTAIGAVFVHRTRVARVVPVK
jgi:hypothetical protein